MRSPSLPWLASSVTSNRSIGHAPRAATSFAPVPGAPVQATSARYDPCAAGCSAHDRETGAPTTRSSAHSTCWHSAFGHACTKTTPWVDRRCTRHLHRLDRSRLPLRTHRFGDALYSAVAEQGSRTQFARWGPHRASADVPDESNVTEGDFDAPYPWSRAIPRPAARRPPDRFGSESRVPRGVKSDSRLRTCARQAPRLPITHSNRHAPTARSEGRKGHCRLTPVIQLRTVCFGIELRVQ